MILNRMAIGGVVLSALLIFGPQPARSADRDALPGWGPFRFSMSLAQAKAVVGLQGMLDAAGNINYETTIDGRPFGASISFAGGGQLIRRVELNREGVETFSPAKCHKEREVLDRRLSLVYGKPDMRDVEKDGSMPGTRSISTTFLFTSGAEIELYEEWRNAPPAPPKCAISIVYRPAAIRAKASF